MESAFRRYIDNLNQGDLSALPTKVRSQHILPAGFEEYEEQKRPHIGIVHVLTDDASGDLAAILHIRCSIEGKQVEFRRHVFCRFAGNRSTNVELDSIQIIDDVDALQKRESKAVQPPQHWSGTPHPEGVKLAELYQAYFQCVNTRNMAEGIPKYCHNVITFNGHPVPQDMYRAVMEECHDVMEEPINTMEKLIVDEAKQCLAARVVFQWKPTKPWGGVKPNGTRATFAEHVFVWFDGGKMHTSISQMDMMCFRQQFNSA